MSALRIAYSFMASLRRPTFSRCSTPSTLYRIHQMPELGTLSKTPRSFLGARLGMGSPHTPMVANREKVAPKVAPDRLEAQSEICQYHLSDLFYWCPEGDLNPHGLAACGF